jgi:hypothetical protein
MKYIKLFLLLILLPRFSFSSESDHLLVNGIAGYDVKDLGGCWGPGKAVYPAGKIPSDYDDCVNKVQMDCYCCCGWMDIKPFFVALAFGRQKNTEPVFDCERAWVDSAQTDLTLDGLRELLKVKLPVEQVNMPPTFDSAMFSFLKKGNNE